MGNIAEGYGQKANYTHRSGKIWNYGQKAGWEAMNRNYTSGQGGIVGRLRTGKGILHMEKLEANPPKELIQTSRVFFDLRTGILGSIWLLKTLWLFVNSKNSKFETPVLKSGKTPQFLLNLFEKNHVFRRVFEKIICNRLFFIRIFTKSFNLKTVEIRFSQRDLPENKLASIKLPNPLTTF